MSNYSGKMASKEEQWIRENLATLPSSAEELARILKAYADQPKVVKESIAVGRWQNLFEALERTCDFIALEDDMQEIINAYEDDLSLLKRPEREEIANKIYMKITSYSPLEKLGHIDKKWIIEKIAEGIGGRGYFRMVSAAEIKKAADDRKLYQYYDDEDNLIEHWDDGKLYWARKMFIEGANCMQDELINQ